MYDTDGPVTSENVNAGSKPFAYVCRIANMISIPKISPTCFRVLILSSFEPVIVMTLILALVQELFE